MPPTLRQWHKAIQSKEKHMTEQPQAVDRSPRHRGRTILVVLIVALAAGLFGAFVTTSFSQGFGPSWHRGMGGPMGMWGPPGPAQIEDRADRMVRHLAIEIDANAEQQAKLEGIIKGAIKEVAPMRDKFLAARQQARELLTQPTVDRAALEKLRAEQIATADALSKRVVQAIGDAAEVLTPDQRRKVNDLLPPAGGYWRPWHRG
jgi:protein CpxP